MFEIIWGLAMIFGIATIVLLGVATKQQREQQRNDIKVVHPHVKVFHPPYDWAKDPEFIQQQRKGT